MINLQKVGIKVPLEGDANGDDIMKSLSSWIRDDRLDGTLIDVADYSHMKNGPGIVLVAHEFILSIDEQDGYIGLRVAHRLNSDKKLNVRLMECIETLRQGAQNLSSDLQMELDGTKVELFASDRLNGNDQAGLSLQNALEEATGAKGTTIDENRDELRLPGISLKLDKSIL